MSSQLDPIMMTFVKTIVVPLLGILGAWVLARLQAYIAAHTKNAKMAGVMNRLTSLAASVVQEVEQTFVSTLEHPTVDDLKAAKDKAMATLKAHLGAKGLQEIQTVLGLDGTSAAERLLSTVIEAAVNDLGNTQAMIAPEPAAPAAKGATP